MLALGLLGPAGVLQPDLGWLFAALEIGAPRAARPRVLFEHDLPGELLGEGGRPTALDVLVDEPDLVICLEAKWNEKGMGTCSCKRDPVESRGSPDPGGRCSPRVLGRWRYWEAAALMGLPEREPQATCPISPGYQVVRNVAAALALAEGRRRAVFGLLYDRHNPYFGGVPERGWPGWTRVLEHTLERLSDRVAFRHLAWQDLMPGLPVDPATAAWAREKHDLPGRQVACRPEPAAEARAAEPATPEPDGPEVLGLARAGAAHLSAAAHLSEASVLVRLAAGSLGAVEGLEADALIIRFSVVIERAADDYRRAAGSIDGTTFLGLEGMEAHVDGLRRDALFLSSEAAAFRSAIEDADDDTDAERDQDDSTQEDALFLGDRADTYQRKAREMAAVGVRILDVANAAGMETSDAEDESPE